GPPVAVDVGEYERELGGACVSADDAYLASGTLYHLEGGVWRDIGAETTELKARRWSGVFAAADDEVYVVGKSGAQVFEGESWRALSLPSDVVLRGV
ncbi:hypothetical protein LZP69_16120, partial [Shewanella sp. AS1]|uniref:hypothetical protein n=1 Tax=Shewanella sp. AS1 TaxID=2907626 RepID=UPI001F343760